VIGLNGLGKFSERKNSSGIPCVILCLKEDEFLETVAEWVMLFWLSVLLV
jgi:hypothetical protein